MTMPPDAEIHTLAAPYALHALPVDEVRLFERHLAECSACRAEVDEIRETSTKLGEATSITPPPALKARVLDQIAAVRPLPPVVEPVDQRSSLRGPAIWRRWWPRLALGAVATLSAVAVVLGVRLGQVTNELDQSQAIGAELRELAAAPDVEVARATEDGTTGTVVLARSLDTAVLFADGMDPAPAQHIYQLWAITGDGMRSAGLLGSTDDGRLGPFTAHGIGTAGQLGITVEPAGGSQQPTSDPVMVIDLPAL